MELLELPEVLLEIIIPRERNNTIVCKTFMEILYNTIDCLTLYRSDEIHSYSYTYGYIQKVKKIVGSDNATHGTRCPFLEVADMRIFETLEELDVNVILFPEILPYISKCTHLKKIQLYIGTEFSMICSTNIEEICVIHIFSPLDDASVRINIANSSKLRVLETQYVIIEGQLPASTIDISINSSSFDKNFFSKAFALEALHLKGIKFAYIIPWSNLVHLRELTIEGVNTNLNLSSLVSLREVNLYRDRAHHTFLRVVLPETQGLRVFSLTGYIVEDSRLSWKLAFIEEVRFDTVEFVPQLSLRVNGTKSMEIHNIHPNILLV